MNHGFGDLTPESYKMARFSLTNSLYVLFGFLFGMYVFLGAELNEVVRLPLPLLSTHSDESPLLKHNREARLYSTTNNSGIDNFGMRIAQAKQARETVWNCDGTFTNLPPDDTYCYKVKSVVRTDEYNGNKTFSKMW